MKRIVGDRVLLRPYRREMVVAYHAWMEDAALREATASERLSLEEEYANQASWAADPRKCTFIIFDRQAAAAGAAGGGPPLAGMCGDVNLFLLEDDDDEGGGSGNGSGSGGGGGNDGNAPGSRGWLAEVMVMVADPASRRRGLAREAVALLMEYGRQHLGVREYVAKVADDNAPSLRLFQDRLQFVEVKRVAAFGEVHLRGPPGADVATNATALGFTVEDDEA